MLISPNELYFGQQHIGTIDYFGENYHTVNIKDTPHYKVLCGIKNVYEDYLKCSWSYLRPKENVSENHKNQLIKFIKLFQDISSDKCKIPIKVCKRFDGKYVIVDGNHRSSICAYLGKEIEAQEISTKRYMRRVATISKERYGIGNSNTPYQSIFYQGKEVVVGRRRDILDRFKLIDKNDINGKSVIDFGCNIGANSFLAAEYGAIKVVGLELSPRILTSAIRLNVMFGFPCYFIQANLSELIFAQKADTGFVFSVDKHVKNDKNLATNIKDHIRRCFYFETHQHSEMPNEIKSICRSEFVGYTGNGDRKFYRCEIK